jgi:hypothetical protein
MPFEPHEAAEACILRSRRLLDLSTSKTLPDGKVRSDLRRSALVIAVSGIDSYMHWLVYRKVSALRREGDLPGALARISIPLAELASLAEAAIQGRQNQIETRPWVQVKHTIQKRLRKETFQTHEQVSNALAMAGVKSAWPRIATLMGISQDIIKTRLDGIVNRRNQIVHEGDIVRASRPRNLQYNEVDSDIVAEDIGWIEELLGAIQEVSEDETE